MNDLIAAKAFDALGHANRVAVLRMLVQAGCNGLNVSQLREALDIPASTLAHHLKTLTDAGLVVQEKDGREIRSCACYEKIRQLNAFLMEDCCRGAFKESEEA